MPGKIARLFTIKTRFEAYLVIYAIALGACERGKVYLAGMPGMTGWLLALACTAVVFVAGAKILDAVALEQAAAMPRRAAAAPAAARRPRRRTITAATVRAPGRHARAQRRLG